MARFSLGTLKTLLIPVILATATLGTAIEPAYRWQVDANGAEGLLELSPGPGGQISGALLGVPVEGWLVGRRLVLSREGSQGRETWEAWLASPENPAGDDLPTLAGAFFRPGEDGPLPWFGTQRPKFDGEPPPLPALAAPVVIQPDQPIKSSPEVASGSQAVPSSTTSEQTVQTPVVEAAPSLPAPAAPRHLPTGQPVLAGNWETPDGPLTIRQTGSGLIFVLPDREVSGRLTGPESLIGGFGPGCCKGQLEQAFTTIAWDNGVHWYRR